METLSYILKLIVAGTEALLIFGTHPMMTGAIIPAFPLLLGMGVALKKGKFIETFLGFMVSFAISQIVLSYVMYTLGISYFTLQQAGLFFLSLFGLILFFPQWSSVFTRGRNYGIIFAFIWSFWMAVPKDTFNPELNVIGLLFFTYFMLVASLPPALFLTALAWILAKLYPEKYLVKIQKMVGVCLLITAALLFFGLLETPHEA